MTSVQTSSRLVRCRQTPPPIIFRPRRFLAKSNIWYFKTQYFLIISTRVADIVYVDIFPLIYSFAVGNKLRHVMITSCVIQSNAHEATYYKIKYSKHEKYIKWPSSHAFFILPHTTLLWAMWTRLLKSLKFKTLLVINFLFKIFIL